MGYISCEEAGCWVAEWQGSDCWGDHWVPDYREVLLASFTEREERMRFVKKPGSEFLDSVDDDTMSLVVGSNVVPDDVRLPPELGGNIVPVVKGFSDTCPSANCGRIVWHLALEGGMGVAECKCRGFLWYRTNREGER